MNKTDFPSLSSANTGVEFFHQEPCRVVDVDYRSVEIACIDLISKLENCLAKSREMEKDDFYDEAGVVGQQMLGLLSKFTEQFLSGESAAQAKQEIDQASTATHAYQEVLKSRPLTQSIIRMFWEVPEINEIKASNSQLSQALVRSCATTFYHAVVLIGLESDFGKEIDQSTAIFVNELKKYWSR